MAVTRQSGIYKITVERLDRPNLFYVGQAKDLRFRFYSHTYFLRHGKHVNKKLQRAYNKYGKDKCKFDILLICGVEMLDFYEERIIKSLDCPEMCNVFKEVVRNSKGVRLSEETKAKISAANKGRKRSAEFCKAVSDRMRGNKPSQETKEKTRIAMLGRTFSKETRRKLSERKKGWKPTPDQIRAMSERIKKYPMTTEVAAKIKTRRESARLRRLLWITSPIVR